MLGITQLLTVKTLWATSVKNTSPNFYDYTRRLKTNIDIFKQISVNQFIKQICEDSKLFAR